MKSYIGLFAKTEVKVEVEYGSIWIIIKVAGR